MRRPTTLRTKIERARLGDQESWSDLLEDYKRISYKCLRLSGYEVTEDLSQDIMLNFVRCVRGFDVDLLPVGWTHYIWVSTYRAARRATKKDRLIGPDRRRLLGIEHLDDGAEDLHLLAVDEVDEAGRLLEALSPRHREIVSRFFGLDGRVDEPAASIADDLGVSRARIYQLRDEALAVMREIA